jgi:hypothetical protein
MVLRDKPVRVFTAGSLNIVCVTITPLCANRDWMRRKGSWAIWAMKWAHRANRPAGHGGRISEMTAARAGLPPRAAEVLWESFRDTAA